MDHINYVERVFMIHYNDIFIDKNNALKNKDISKWPQTFERSCTSS